MFTFEATVKIIALKEQYFKVSWNIFDFIVCGENGRKIQIQLEDVFRVKLVIEKFGRIGRN